MEAGVAGAEFSACQTEMITDRISSIRSGQRGVKNRASVAPQLFIVALHVGSFTRLEDREPEDAVGGFKYIVRIDLNAKISARVQWTANLVQLGKAGSISRQRTGDIVA